MSLLGALLWIIMGAYGFIMVLYFDVEDDIKKWRNIQEVLHRKESIQRALYLTMPIGAFLILPIHNDRHWILSVFGDLALLSSWYWLLFDGLYNKERGQDWWFPGSPNGKEDDSWIDKHILRKLPGWEFIAGVKVSYIVFSTLFYIWLVV